ncbi:MAG: hypothetical protein ICV70_07070 [Jiangellaceae bacterium]|nr:hypothetical protein [Jiangellaceae bacterium]
MPATDPPFDDESADDRSVRAAHALPIQGSLALAPAVAGGLPAMPEAAAALRLVEHPGPAHASMTPPERLGNATLPDARRWSARLGQGIVEALHGHRPVQQLLRWTDDQVYDALARRITGRGPAEGTRPVVRSVHVCHPVNGVVEATLVVGVGVRTRALAMRLEAVDGRWRCTALDIL